MATTSIERDSLGSIEVPPCRLRGAQTQRPLVTEMEFDPWVQPEEMVHAGAKRLSAN